LGDLLNRRERAAKLQSYAEKTLSEIAATTSKIAADKKIPVYYAEGTDGLATERDSSFHVESLRRAGGRNVHRGEALDHYGMEKISMEQVMLYNPEVILVQERDFYAKIYSDPHWKGIKAVRDKRVYQIPKIPFNWFDRPPSFMRLLGLKWLTNVLYPQLYPLNLAKETREFYQLFLGITLSDDNLREIVGR
jgi:iron complex transport system substrate-binding protein